MPGRASSEKRGGSKGEKKHGTMGSVQQREEVAALSRLSLNELADPSSNKMSAPPESHHDLVCAICTEHLNDSLHRPAVGPCEHLDTCSLCYIRLRRLFGDQTCPMCKAQQENIYIFESPATIKPHKYLNIWGENAGPNMVFDDASRSFMPKDFYQEVYQQLQSPNCRICRDKCRSLSSLHEHLKMNHDRYLCDVCIEHKKVFLGEQQLYSKSDLLRHRDKGDPSHGFFGHPSCNFCKKRFYDTGHLYEHFTKSHYSCDLCEREGIQHKYYRDYPDLERHFRQQHHLCEDPRCLEQRFVVFSNPIDFQGHIIAAHPEQGSSRKLAVSFRVRRAEGSSDMSSSGGSSGALEASSSDQPSSFQMTSEQFPDLSQQTARTRSRMFGADNTLTTADRRNTGFAPSSSRRFTGEDFPALGGGSGGSYASSTSRGPSAFRNALIPPPTRACLLYQDRDRWSYPDVDISRGGSSSSSSKKSKKKMNDRTLAGAGAVGNSSGQQEQAFPPLSASSTAAAAAATVGPEEEKRNEEELMQGIQELIGEESFTSLRNISRDLRSGQLSGPEYYDAVIALIPSRPIRIRIMLDLIEVLPDEELRKVIEDLINTIDRRERSNETTVVTPSTTATPVAPHAPSSAEQFQHQQAVMTKSSKKKKPSKGPISNGWAKALANASGSSSKPFAVPKGQKPAGLTIVRFKSSDNDASIGRRDGVGSIREDEFPSLPPISHAGTSWVGKKDITDEDEDEKKTTAATTQKKKKGNNRKKLNELQALAFNFR